MEVEERELVMGWPSDGGGLWVLRCERQRDVPKDFGRVNLAVDMNERCQVIREYGGGFLQMKGRLSDLIKSETPLTNFSKRKSHLP